MPTITERITELRESRANIDTEQRQLTDLMVAESRALSAEERQKDDQLNTAFETATEELRRLEQQVARDADLRNNVPLPAATEDEIRSGRTNEDEVRSAFVAYCRGQATPEQRSVLTAAPDLTGGVTVPQYWNNNVIEPARQFGVVRQYAETLTTEGGNTFKYPRVSAAAAAVTIVPEGTLIPDDAEEFDSIDLGAYKYAKIVKADDEFVQDTGIVDLPAWITRRGMEDISLAQGGHFVKGTGASQPLGLFTGAAVGKAAASLAAVTGDEAMDLLYSVQAAYRAFGRWLANDLTIAALRKLKDGNGNYLWQIGLKDGEPDRFLGYPLDSDPFVDGFGANKKPLGFGDIQRAYVVRAVNSLEIRYLVERYADLGQVAWRLQERVDGDVKDPNAFKTLQQPAS